MKIEFRVVWNFLKIARESFQAFLDQRDEWVLNHLVLSPTTVLMLKRIKWRWFTPRIGRSSDQEEASPSAKKTCPKSFASPLRCKDVLSFYRISPVCPHSSLPDTDPCFLIPWPQIDWYCVSWLGRIFLFNEDALRIRSATAAVLELIILLVQNCLKPGLITPSK